MMRRLTINSIVKGHGKIYMQIMSLKNNFITRIIGYREEQT